jgi:SAM-dependent methyltransferase
MTTTVTFPCPACAGPTHVVRQSFYGDSDLVRCAACGTEALSPQPSDERLAAIYDEDYYAPWGLDTDRSVEAMKRGTFEWVLAQRPLRAGSAVLDLGCATGFLMSVAAERGLRPYGIDLNPLAVAQVEAKVPEASVHCGTLADHPFDGISFDGIFMIDFLEHVRDPELELSLVRERLTPDGATVISLPKLDSLSRTVLRYSWNQYREEHLTYFTQVGLTGLLRKLGFEISSVKRTRKVMTLGYLHRQLQTYRHPVLTPTAAVMWRVLPFARGTRIPVTMGEMTVVARRA